MKKVTQILLLLLLGVACSEKVIEKPEDLIPREKMVNILYDLSLINAGKAIDPIALERHSIKPMEYVFRKYEVDSAQFVRSDLYYAAMPLEYEAIYRELEERLEKETLRIEEERTQKSDSARRRNLEQSSLED